jgi:OOP family OmpA-OmpF porin
LLLSKKLEVLKTGNKLSKSLAEFAETEIIILGHTDSSGSREYNQKLSNQRANSVIDYLTHQGVIPNTKFWTSSGQSFLWLYD